MPLLYPIPRLEDIFERMDGSRYFSTIDLKAGYHQIRIDLRDDHKTAFQFERGKYEYLRMPMGLKNAPATFQRLMDEFLEGMDDALQIYMDDVIVFSRTKEEHKRHLTQLRDLLATYGLKVSREKSIFFQTEIKFLGYRLSQLDIMPDTNEVAAIAQMPMPQNMKELRSFLGMTNYYRRFIGNYADLVEPLTGLLKKDRNSQ